MFSSSGSLVLAILFIANSWLKWLLLLWIVIIVSYNQTKQKCSFDHTFYFIAHFKSLTCTVSANMTPCNFTSASYIIFFWGGSKTSLKLLKYINPETKSVAEYTVIEAFMAVCDLWQNIIVILSCKGKNYIWLISCQQHTQMARVLLHVNFALVLCWDAVVPFTALGCGS